MKINSPQLNLMHRACMKASKVLIRDFGEIEKLQVSEKGPGDFVTASDKRVEKNNKLMNLMLKVLNTQFCVKRKEN